MDAITQAIVNKSKLEVSHIKITNATPDSFIMSIQSRVTGTGPIGATMAGMTVGLVGPGGAFGQLELPDVKTSSSGADVTIDDQLIKITDMEAFKAFVKSVTQDAELTLHLKNGKTTLKALGMTANINYEKPVHLKGMNGPATRITKTEVNGDSYTNTTEIDNPSPFEIDLGDSIFEIQSTSGQKLGVSEGPIYIVRGKTQFTMSGKAQKGADPGSGEAFWVGVGAGNDSWTKETNKFVKSKVQLTPELVSLVKG